MIAVNSSTYMLSWLIKLHSDLTARNQNVANTNLHRTSSSWYWQFQNLKAVSVGAWIGLKCRSWMCPGAWVISRLPSTFDVGWFEKSNLTYLAHGRHGNNFRSHFIDWYHEYFQGSCYHLNATEPRDDNGLELSGNMSLSVPMLTRIYVAILCH